MDLTKETIEHIQSLSCYDNVCIGIGDTREPLALIPDGYRVKSLDEHNEFLTFFKEDFLSANLNSYLAYCDNYKKGGAVCYISKNMIAETIFDIGTPEKPEHKLHRAGLSLDKLSPYVSLLLHHDNSFSQKSVSDWLEDWSEDIVIFASDGTLLTSAKAAASIRDLTIETAREARSHVGDFSQTMSAIEKIEAKRAYDLPAEIEFKCIPYLHFEQRIFKLRLSILTGGDKPMVKFRIVRLEAVQEELIEEFEEKLIKGLSKKIKVYLGVSR